MINYFPSKPTLSFCVLAGSGSGSGARTGDGSAISSTLACTGSTVTGLAALKLNPLFVTLGDNGDLGERADGDRGDCADDERGESAVGEYAVCCKKVAFDSFTLFLIKSCASCFRSNLKASALFFPLKINL